jgi:hypothetical protein
MEQRVVLPTSALTFALGEDPRFARTTALVRFEGNFTDGGGLPDDYVAPVEWDEERGIWVGRLVVEERLFVAADPDPTRTFIGAIDVEVSDQLGVLARGRVEGALLQFMRTLDPGLVAFGQAGEVWPGQVIEVECEGALRPEEGTTWAVVERGALVYEDGEQVDKQGARVPLRWLGSRERAGLEVAPEVFGIRPGAFAGALRLENTLDGPFERTRSTARPLEVEIGRARIDSVAPAAASRGQLVRIVGRGFLEPNAARGVGMLLSFEGTFRPSAAPDLAIDYTGSRAVERVPRRVRDATVIEQDVWYEVDEQGRTLEGLGAQPGVFEGRIVPVLVSGADELRGGPWEGAFTVAPTVQVVHVRFLPSFATALERFGLANVDAEVRARIIEVLERDYAGLRVRFVREEPEEYLDYMTIEIGGADPTGLGVFGYDNSFNGVPKDVGNLFLADYLGGYNSASAGAGFQPYGGVFVESFLVFSPSLSSNTSQAEPAFDTILGPFMPELGGEPVLATEWPGGPRADRIRGAILMIGNLAGHTASHEIGHSLGLPYVEGEDPRAEQLVYHNDGRLRGDLMDPGSGRPFAVRAEIGGEGPSAFNAENRAYLERILGE